jgi:cyanophycinase-like exopeptidase
MPGTITIMGSGEMTETLGRVHRAVMARIEGPVRPVFLDTPAGFQLNADELSDRAVAYFQQRFQLPLAVASLKDADRPTPAGLDAARRAVRGANYLFAGPGSPTYAVRHWQASGLGDLLAQRLAAGAHIVFASAAAITLGRHTLPVYEVYKVGEPPRWAAGLDLFGPYGMDVAVVPHWNNAEGGTHDTRFCFMGAPRLALLEAMLPPTAVILGVDEYTACVVDLTADVAQVMGVGQVTIRHQGQEQTFPDGTSFSLNLLRRPEAEARPLPVAPAGDPAATLRARIERTRSLPADAPAADVLGALYELADTADVARSAGIEETLLAEAQTLQRERLTGLCAGESAPASAPLIELLIAIRARLRAAGQWPLADEIRNGLAAQGIVLEDNRAGTTWRTASSSDRPLTADR